MLIGTVAALTSGFVSLESDVLWLQLIVTARRAEGEEEREKGERKEGEMCLVVTRWAAQQISLQSREILEGWAWALLTIVLSAMIFNFSHSQLSAAFVCRLKTSPSLSFSSVQLPAHVRLSIPMSINLFPATALLNWDGPEASHFSSCLPSPGCCAVSCTHAPHVCMHRNRKHLWQLDASHRCAKGIGGWRRGGGELCLEQDVCVCCGQGAGHLWTAGAVAANLCWGVACFKVCCGNLRVGLQRAAGGSEGQGALYPSSLSHCHHYRAVTGHGPRDSKPTRDSHYWCHLPFLIVSVRCRAPATGPNKHFRALPSVGFACCSGTMEGPRGE